MSTFQATNPATGTPVGAVYQDATPADVDAAVQQAEAAFQVYRKTPNTQRAAFLDRAAEEILALGDTLIQTCRAETGLPEGRLTGERGRTVNQLRLFAEVVREGSWVDARIDLPDPGRKPVPKPDVRQVHQPLGPVAVFGASNFPLAFSVAGGDTASALAAGCTVVVKGHPAHPGTSDLIAAALQEAAQASGMPAGTISLLHGASVAVGRALVEHPMIQAVGFTGSFRGGKALFDAAVRRPVPIPVFAEMGSTNPVFILPGALRARSQEIAAGLVQSVTLGVGQFCTNPGVVVLPGGGDGAAFIDQAATALAQVPAPPMLTPGIHRAFHEGVAHHSGIDGVQVRAQGQAGEGPCAGVAYLLEATADTVLQHPSLEEEVFGPSTLAVTTSAREQMLALAERLQGHLTATLHAAPGELAAYQDLIDILERKVGRLIINGFPTGVEVGHAMHHGGPYPSTTAPQYTSVGTAAIRRFARPVCYQNFPQDALPQALQNANPLHLWRLVDGKPSQATL